MCDKEKIVGVDKEKIVGVDRGNNDVKVYMNMKPEVSKIVPEIRTTPKNSGLNYVDDALRLHK